MIYSLGKVGEQINESILNKWKVIYRTFSSYKIMLTKALYYVRFIKRKGLKIQKKKSTIYTHVKNF